MAKRSHMTIPNLKNMRGFPFYHVLKRKDPEIEMGRIDTLVTL